MASIHVSVYREFPLQDFTTVLSFCSGCNGDGCGRAMVLGNSQCLGVLLIWIIAGQGPTVLAVVAGGVLFDFFL